MKILFQIVVKPTPRPMSHYVRHFAENRSVIIIVSVFSPIDVNIIDTVIILSFLNNSSKESVFLNLI